MRGDIPYWLLGFRSTSGYLVLCMKDTLSIGTFLWLVPQQRCVRLQLAFTSGMGSRSAVRKQPSPSAGISLQVKSLWIFSFLVNDISCDE
jgi:hypothetical protein